MELRWYQAEAVEAVWKHMREGTGNPVVELPTGAGKSLVIAELTRQAVHQWNGRVLILQHVKELIEQNAAKLQALCPTIRVGLYSAGLKRREADAPVVVAGVQSVYDKADRLGRFDLVLIDEGHLVPEDGDGMYRQLIRAMQEANPDLVIIGLTATPYRTGDGPICSTEGLLNAICYRVSVKTLIAQGFLSKLIGRRAEHEIDTTGIHVRAGEFVEGEVEERMGGVVQQAADEIVHQCRDRKACLVFCQTVAHAEQVAGHILRAVQVRQLAARLQTAPARDLFDLGSDELAAPVLPIVADWLDDEGKPTDHLRRYLDTGRETVAVVTGQTPGEERAELIRRFRAGELKYLVNVNVLTTGFDAPNVDCVAILRATLSPGLFYQMVGRGFRVCDGKENALILDFGGNIERHGPVDDIRPRVRGKAADAEAFEKMCPDCRAVVSPAVRTCPGCGYVWPVEAREPNHAGTADGDPLSGGKTETTYQVSAVQYSLHTKKGADDTAPKTLRVTYRCGLADYVSEWVCLEHPEGVFAHQKALKWWAKRCQFPAPDTITEAVAYGQFGLLAEPTEIVVRRKGKDAFPEIVKHVLTAKPDGPSPCRGCGDVVNIVVAMRSDLFNELAAQCGLCGHPRGGTSRAVYDRVAVEDADMPGYRRLVFPAILDDAGQPPVFDDTANFDLLTAVESVGTDDDLPF